MVRFRNALREVLITAETVEYGRLFDKQEDLEPTESKADLERMGELSDRQSRLNRAWKNSICTCSICGSRTSDIKVLQKEKKRRRDMVQREREPSPFL